MIIKEELWKNKGYVAVARNDKGNILGWTKTDKPFEFYKNKFKRDGSFKEGVRVDRFKNGTVEYIDFNRKKINRPYQVIIEGYIGSKQVVSRSKQEDPKYPNKKMLEEAEENFRMGVLKTYYGVTDPDITEEESRYIFTGEIPKKALKKNFKHLPRLYIKKVGVVYYKTKSQ